MVDWVSLVLRLGYYCGQIIGARNFEVDWRTGRVFKTTRSTRYSIVCNVILTLRGLMLIGEGTFSLVSGGTRHLYLYVIFTLFVLRSIAGLATLHNQWRYQSQHMLLAKNSLCLWKASPQWIRMSRWPILLMIIIFVVPDLLLATVTINQADTNIYLRIFLYIWISAILNLALAHQYLVMLCIQWQHNQLNAELKQVIEESKNLSYKASRKGSFMTRCCDLADQVDDIAKLQEDLQSMVTQLDRLFGVQSLFVFSGYYVSAVATIYTTYRIFKKDLSHIVLNLRQLILPFIWSFCFYMAGILNLFMALHIQDSHKDMIQILEERTLFAPGLDVRLETSFESLQLQLIRNPLKMHVFKQFPANRQVVWGTFGSMLLNSISLIQYDIEHFEKEYYKNIK